MNIENLMNDLHWSLSIDGMEGSVMLSVEMADGVIRQLNNKNEYIFSTDMFGAEIVFDRTSFNYMYQTSLVLRKCWRDHDKLIDEERKSPEWEDPN